MPDIEAGVAAARAFDEREGPYIDIDWRSDYARQLVAAILEAQEKQE